MGRQDKEKRSPEQAGWQGCELWVWVKTSLNEYGGWAIEDDSGHQRRASTWTHVYCCLHNRVPTGKHGYTLHKHMETEKENQIALLIERGDGKKWAERPLLHVWFSRSLIVAATHGDRWGQQTQQNRVWFPYFNSLGRLEVPSCQSKLTSQSSSKELCLPSVSYRNTKAIHFEISL